MHELQAAAAVGQMGLFRCTIRAFDGTACTRRRCSSRTADLATGAVSECPLHLLTLLGLGIIPVINENDTVVTDESGSATTTRSRRW